MEENLMPANDEARKKIKMYRKKRVLIPILFLLISIILVGGYWFLYLRDFVSTDDAFLDANQVDLSSKILGRIVELKVDEGEKVKQGEILVQLDDSDLKAEEVQEKENVIYSQENVSLAKVNLQRAEEDFRRISSLFKDSVVTSEQFDHTQKTLDMAQAQYKIALAQVGTSKAKLNVVQTKLQSSKIIAPMNGVVAKKWVMPGDVIQPGQPILTIYDLENIWVTANFEETKLASIRLQDIALISVDAYPKIKLEGKVIFIGAVTASQFSLIPPNNASGNFTKVTQRVPVKISFDKLHLLGGSDPAKLLPGMSVEVKIRTKGN